MKLNEIQNAQTKTHVKMALQGLPDVNLGKTWDVNNEGLVTVVGDVVIKNVIQQNLPFKFASIIGKLTIMDCGFTTLEWCPESAGYVYMQGCDKLKSLKGFPNSVKSLMIHHCNELESLEGISQSIIKDVSLVSLPKITSLKGFNTGSNIAEFTLTQMPGIKSFEHIPENIRELNLLEVGIQSFIGIADYVKQVDTISFDEHQIYKGGLGLILCARKILRSRNKPISSKKFKIIEKYMGKPELIFECQAELIDKGFEAAAEL